MTMSSEGGLCAQYVKSLHAATDLLPMMSFSDQVTAVQILTEICSKVLKTYGSQLAKLQQQCTSALNVTGSVALETDTLNNPSNHANQANGLAQCEVGQRDEPSTETSMSPSSAHTVHSPVGLSGTSDKSSEFCQVDHFITIKPEPDPENESLLGTSTIQADELSTTEFMNDMLEVTETIPHGVNNTVPWETPDSGQQYARRKFTCSLCKAKVFNLNRHRATKHNCTESYRMSMSEVLLRRPHTKRRYKRCLKCHKLVVRLDHHLQSKSHSTLSPSERKEILKKSKANGDDMIGDSSDQ